MAYFCVPIYNVMQIQNAVLISIGDELLIGQTIDTNSAWIARQLNKIGINIQRKLTISDDANEIKTTLDNSIPGADLLVLTGGLGPTNDDITKQTLNEYFGGTLQRNQTVYEHVVNFFRLKDRPMLPVNAFQADVPDNCEILFNRTGTAPGMLFKKDNTWIVSLPGVPREMQTIVEEELLPRIKAQAVSSQHIIYRNLILFGRGESYVADDIKDIENALPKHIHLSYLPNHGELKLRLSGTGSNFQILNAELDVFFRLIRDREIDFVVAEEDVKMEEAIVRLLQQNRLTLSTAESCTGGLIASKITDVPGASAVYMGSVVSYDNKIKNSVLSVSNETLNTLGAVSAATVEQMATAVRSMMQTDIAVAVSGILGPSGGTPEKPVGLVYFGIASALGTQSFHFNFHYDRAINKEMVAKTALNLIRKEIANLMR